MCSFDGYSSGVQGLISLCGFNCHFCGNAFCFKYIYGEILSVHLKLVLKNSEIAKYTI